MTTTGGGVVAGRRKPAVRLAAVVGTLALGVSACGPATESTVLTSAGGVHVVVGSGGIESGNSAGVQGRLAILEGGCLGLLSDDPRRDPKGEVIVWPAGTTIQDGDPFRIKTPGLGGSQVVKLGDLVHGPGGGGSPATVGAPQLPPECHADEVFVLVPDFSHPLSGR
jgi:hypothetical protein